MKYLVSLFSAFIFLCCIVTAQAKTIINGVEENSPPFSYVDEQGNRVGIAIDLLNWIGKKYGFEVKHLPVETSERISALLEKKIDIIFCALSITPERSKLVSFSHSYLTIEKIIAVRKESKLTSDEVFIRPTKIGVQRGTSEHEMLSRKKIKEGLPYNLYLFDSYPLAIDALLDHKVEAVAIDSVLANTAIRKGKAIKKAGSYAKYKSYGMAVRKEDTELLDIINEGLIRIKEEPYFLELLSKYY